MKLGLALSGGGVKGAAHIGVLQAFYEKGVKIDYISGTSSGSIVAALYAIGYNPKEIYTLFKKYCKKIGYITPVNIFKLIWGIIVHQRIIIDGLNNGNSLELIIDEACKDKQIDNISQVKMPLLIPSVELVSGRLNIFSSFKEDENQKRLAKYIDDIKYVNDVRLSKAVRCSCSYPGVFEPATFNNVQFIDGGIRENVPWKELKRIGAQKVICVVFDEDSKLKKKQNIIDVVESSIDILSHELSNYELEGADELLKIETRKISLLDCSKIEYLYEMGYNIAKKYLINNKLKEGV